MGHPSQPPLPPHHAARSERPNTARWLATIVIGLAVAGGLAWWMNAPSPGPTAPPAPLETAAASPPAPSPPPAPAPLVHLKLDATLDALPAPAAAQREAALLQALAGWIGKQHWSSLVVPERLIQRIVATVDNLPRRDAPVSMWPLKPAEGWIATDVTPPGRLLSAANAQRYDRHVGLLGRLPHAALADLYVRHYVLFQQSYEALGYPDAVFHDRLRFAIADLLATPEPDAPLALAEEKVRYRFADPGLDGRSAGQKLLLRMGVGHTRTVKAWLRGFAAALARHETTLPAPERSPLQ